MGKVDLTLNGNPVSGSEGMTILELAQENDVDIPTLCYLSELTPTGSCRICVVEVAGSRTLVASCHTPIQPDMDIQTHSPKVLKARRVILELLFASHSGSCLMCDKANLCELRKIAADLNFDLPRIRGERSYYPIEELSPYIVRDLSKCILCRRCVRACREIKGEGVFGIGYRGFGSKIVVDLDQELDKSVCESCDVCVEVCPVGALTKRSERFKLKKKGTPLVITG
jgi:NADH dehydrogenase/NADH:ubiquinone oxidoreductase subunit G